ncbi:HalOD1 output domain-containing protein [Halobacteriaceae archaeon SHR40]|uniref:HalOD1 output domain-containing protein n=1 Tax=Halovenus amylolytica TaxID=2500550 RepID=UPI000FE3C250
MPSHPDRYVGSVEEPAESDHGTSADRAAVTRSWDPDDSFLLPLIEAITERTDRSTEEIEPVYSAIDPDALETILSRDERTGTIQVSFTYEGCEVTLSNTGELVVDPAGIDG